MTSCNEYDYTALCKTPAYPIRACVIKTKPCIIEDVDDDGNFKVQYASAVFGSLMEMESDTKYC